MTTRLHHLGRVIKMVLASFIGVRKAVDAQVMQKLSLRTIIFAALGCGVCLILLLVLLVKTIVYYAH